MKWAIIKQFKEIEFHGVFLANGEMLAGGEGIPPKEWNGVPFENGEALIEEDEESSVFARLFVLD